MGEGGHHDRVVGAEGAAQQSGLLVTTETTVTNIDAAVSQQV
jgi:hypothetical protein